MADSGDGEILLGGGGGEQGPGAAEEDLLELSRGNLTKKFGTQHDGTASAPGAARVDILPDGVEDEIPTVRQLPADGDARLPAEGNQRLHPDGPKIPGDDEVVVFGRCVRVLEMGRYGGKRGGG